MPQVLDVTIADHHVGVAVETGATSRGMSAASYWLSASVLTTTSAPSFSDASRPA